MKKARCLAAFGALLVLFVAPLAAMSQPPSKAQEPAKKELTDADVPRMSVDELILAMAKKQPVVVIDVRNPDTYTDKIRGALEIPLDQIESRLKEIPRNKEIVTYCA